MSMPFRNMELQIIAGILRSDICRQHTPEIDGFSLFLSLDAIASRFFCGTSGNFRAYNSIQRASTFLAQPEGVTDDKFSREWEAGASGR
jgi:hypothetical protein